MKSQACWLWWPLPSHRWDSAMTLLMTVLCAMTLLTIVLGWSS